MGIMGRSGTGKTTLLRLVMGLVKPSAGRILVFGRDIVGLSEEQLDRVRLDMGMVFQGAALFDSMTVAENVAFGLVEHRRLPRSGMAGRVRELLEMVDMSGSEDLMPVQLSGGMRKRVGIARALAMEPSLMLYDEPTAGLDPISAVAIDTLIVRLCEQVGVTSVIASHDVPSLRRVADRVALLHNGTFTAVGSMAELEASADPVVRQFLSGSPEGPMTGEAE
jgi:phospholipid/cholesterol/gamma-HCH transport system ATP-binding protein